MGCHLPAHSQVKGLQVVCRHTRFCWECLKSEQKASLRFVRWLDRKRESKIGQQKEDQGKQHGGAGAWNLLNSLHQALTHICEMGMTELFQESVNTHNILECIVTIMGKVMLSVLQGCLRLGLEDVKPLCLFSAVETATYIPGVNMLMKGVLPGGGGCISAFCSALGLFFLCHLVTTVQVPHAPYCPLPCGRQAWCMKVEVVGRRLREAKLKVRAGRRLCSAETLQLCLSGSLLCRKPVLQALSSLRSRLPLLSVHLQPLASPSLFASTIASLGCSYGFPIPSLFSTLPSVSSPRGILFFFFLGFLFCSSGPTFLLSFSAVSLPSFLFLCTPTFLLCFCLLIDPSTYLHSLSHAPLS